MKTLKNQMVLALFLVAFIPVGILVWVYFSTTIRTQRAEFTGTRLSIMEKTADNIEKQLIRTDSFTNQILSNQGLQTLLRRSGAELDQTDSTFLDTQKELETIYLYSALYDQIQTVLILGDNGLDLRYGVEAAFYDSAALFGEERGDGRPVWGGQRRNPYLHSGEPVVIPVYSRIVTQQGGVTGQVLILFGEEMLRSCYSDAAPGSSGEFFLIDQDGILLAGSEDASTLAGTQEMLAEARRALSGGSTQVQITGGPRQEEHLVTACLAGEGWIAVEISPMGEISRMSRSFTLTALILLCSAMGVCFLLSMQISKALTTPLQKIVGQVQRIGSGDLAVEPLPERGSAEIQVLGRNINAMQASIAGLMAENLNKEKEKHSLEIQMLQNQIHPHFLHNTLNTIKMMAVLQGSAGIEKMITALSRMLRYALSGNREYATLGEEIAVLEDYTYIQRIHYKARLTYRTEIPDQALLARRVPRFILQPIVENSVIHGLSDSGSVGEVVLRAWEQGDRLVVEIVDNGAGISPDQLAELNRQLEGPDREAGDSMPRGMLGIGLVNVHRRIRLLDGEGCGIRVESVPGEYTRVLLELKLQEGGMGQ